MISCPHRRPQAGVGERPGRRIQPVQHIGSPQLLGRCGQSRGSEVDLGVVQSGGGRGVAGHLPGSWSLIPLAIDYVVGVLVAGRTLGMYLFGLRLVRVDRPVPLDIFRVLVRTVLLMLLVPAVIWDRDGRGLHDRLTESAVVRA